MAKLSLSWAINRKKRIRVGTALAVLLLLFFGVSMMASRNPKGTKAASTISASRSILASNLTYDDTELTISGASTVVTIYGQHTFKSLTITNGARLTHEALASSDIEADGSTLLVSGSIKKVDLIVEGAVVFDSGGSINVDGNGYPGAYYTWCDGNNAGHTLVAKQSGTEYYGFGPGGGLSFPANYNYTWAGGGGFGGAGALPAHDYNVIVSLGSGSYNYLINKYGSGGGAADHAGSDDHTCFNGGNGGGSISIKADTIRFNDSASSISANGTKGALFNGQQENNYVHSGGGSGGSIVLSANSIIYNTSIMTSLPNVNNLGGSYLGNTGQINVSGFDINGIYQINATGGDYGNERYLNNLRGGGGGGWIVINKSLNQPVTIKKTLVPVNRNNASPANTSFNPYALQRGDRIRVNFEVTNLILGALTMTDEMLQVKYSNPAAYCEYVSSTSVPGGATYIAPDRTLVWDYTVADADLTAGQTFSYECIVQ